jgi:hypothetical protein
VSHLSPLTHVDVGMLHPERFRDALDDEHFQQFIQVATA